MKINFNQPIFDFTTGKQLPRPDAEEGATLEWLTVTALKMPVDQPTPLLIMARYDLIKKIHGAAGPVSLTAEQVASIKELIVKAFQSPLVCGTALELLEGEE